MRALAAAALLLAATPAAAADEDAQLWTTAIATGPGVRNLAAWVELQARFGDDVSRLSQSKLRVALGYRFGDALTVYGGYAYVTSHLAGRSDKIENRLWQQASYAVVRSGPVRLNGRTRLEQRFFNTGSDTGWRLRQQLRFGAGGIRRKRPELVVRRPTAIRRRTCRSRRLSVLLPPEHGVRREVRGGGFHYAVAEGREI